ncbi:MAG: Gfo/Idh/MocA family oxidoreductase [Planctomycetes bacterium]|nr:Gfo/Idh/MocA family oxidoreductase [Planctomycetota bacterium]
MKPLLAGVIGLGVGQRHVATYQSLEGVRVKSVCDLDPTRLESVADAYGIERKADDYRAVTEDPDIDVISICSYDDSHAEQAISALRHGKHVMIEKPIALHPKEAEGIVRAMQESGKRITSNLILRQSPRFRHIKAMIEAGEFGDIFCIEGDYLHQILWKITDGWRGRMKFYCTVYGGGIHLIDLMRWLLGQEVESVCGMATDMPTRGSPYPRDDTFINVLRFSNGTLGKCLTSFAVQRPIFHSLNVYGTKRTFVNDVPDAKIFSGDTAADQAPFTTPYPGMEKGDLLPDFIDAIRTGREPMVSARDVFRVMDICFAAWEATNQGRTVQVQYLL